MNENGMPWKHFLHYWAFVSGIKTMDLPRKGLVMQGFTFSLSLDKNTVEQSVEFPAIW